MSPSAVIDSIPLDTLWRCSETIHHCSVSSGEKPFPVWIFLCAALILGFIVTSKSAPSLKGMQFRIGLTQIITILAILVSDSIIFGGTFIFLSPTPSEFSFGPSLFFLLTFSAKISLLLFLTDILRTPCFKEMIPANLALATFIPCLTSLFSLASVLIPTFSHGEYPQIPLVILTAIAVIVYIFALIRILFRSKTSLFYSFLYLCTLEFIPIAVVTTMLTRL